MNKLIPTVFLSLCAVLCRAQAGNEVYSYLRLPVSAHAAAVGGDNVSLIEDDASLIFHNPALLSSVSDKTLNLNYMTYMSGSQMLSASFAKAADRSTWGASAQYMGYGSMKQTDENNADLGTFSAKDISLAGYYSYLLTDRLSGGIAMKFISSYIGAYNALAMGVDLGINYYDDEKGWSLSGVVRNLGGQLSPFDDEFERLPLDVQVGASKRFVSVPLRLSVTLTDLNHWNYSALNHVVIGADLLLSSAFWVGGGYNFRRAKEMRISGTTGESSHGAGFSVGTGLNLERFKVNLAYGKYHLSSHSITVNLAYSL